MATLEPSTRKRRGKGIGGHTRPGQGTTVEWLTPPAVIEALTAKFGSFDLDPCSVRNRPWDTAERHILPPSDGLCVPWEGEVWLNPPYTPDLWRWLSRLADHNDGVAIIFARTETDLFFRYVWSRASAVLFLKGRLHFHYLSGERAKGNAGGPSVLVAYGEKALGRLEWASTLLPGMFLTLRNPP